MKRGRRDQRGRLDPDGGGVHIQVPPEVDGACFGRLDDPTRQVACHVATGIVEWEHAHRRRGVAAFLDEHMAVEDVDGLEPDVVAMGQQLPPVLPSRRADRSSEECEVLGVAVREHEQLAG